MKKKLKLYLNLSFIALLLLGVFSLSLRLFYGDLTESLDFYNWHQTNNKTIWIKQIRPETELSYFETVGKGAIKNKQFLNKDGQPNNAKPANSQNIPILMYHYISRAPATTTLAGLYLDPTIFANQLKEIKAADYNSFFVSEIAQSLKEGKALPPKSLALTFDDGYADFYTQAWPLLKKYNLKSTLYVIINDLDKPGYIKSSELKELAGSGLVEIGSHTFNHPDLRTLTARQTNYEINLSRQALARLSGQPILSFAYPFGLYTYQDLRVVVESAYLAAVSTNPGAEQSPSSLFVLNRLRPGGRQGNDFIAWLKAW
ncbi:MAG: polysaccharide deacetylase family protein [Candidatus Falkowbacteria bacterium]|nr:polysaccharide deacetylase family protein [Candidatus Falkowbacteria bacterium]